MEIVTIPGRKLIYPFAIPLNLEDNYVFFIFVNIFQYLGLMYQVVVGAAVDTEAAGNMIFLVGHIKALRTRISKIGWDKSKTLEENYREFVNCIVDHSILLE